MSSWTNGSRLRTPTSPSSETPNALLKTLGSFTVTAGSIKSVVVIALCTTATQNVSMHQVLPASLPRPTLASVTAVVVVEAVTNTTLVVRG